MSPTARSVAASPRRAYSGRARDRRPRRLPRPRPEAVVDPFDAAWDAQALGLLGIVARELGQLAAQEVEPGVELALAGVRAPLHAHRAVDARLCLWPRVARVELAPQLRPAAGEAVERL